MSTECHEKVRVTWTQKAKIQNFLPELELQYEKTTVTNEDIVLHKARQRIVEIRPSLWKNMCN